MISKETWCFAVLFLLGSSIACTTLPDNETAESAAKTPDKETAQSKAKSPDKESIAPSLAPNQSPNTSAKTSDSFSDEIRLGRQMAGVILAQRTPIENPRVVEAVSEVGLLVAQNSPFASRKFAFEVLQEETPNAFACPGGYIFVTSGLLKNLKNEAELAAVLGHEIAHVGHQHILQALKKEKIVAPAKPQDSILSGRERVVAPKSELGEFLSSQLASAGSLSNSVFQVTQDSLNLIFSKGLEKSLELEADQEGIKYANRAGYEAKALAAFFQRQSKVPEKRGFQKTHPTFADRHKDALSFLASNSESLSRGAEAAERWKKLLSNLTRKTKEDGT